MGRRQDRDLRNSLSKGQTLSEITPTDSTPREKRELLAQIQSKDNIGLQDSQHALVSCPNSIAGCTRDLGSLRLLFKSKFFFFFFLNNSRQIDPSRDDCATWLRGAGSGKRDKERSASWGSLVHIMPLQHEVFSRHQRAWRREKVPWREGEIHSKD